MVEFMEQLRDLINGNSELPNVDIGQLKEAENNVSIQLITSSTENDYFDRGKTIPFTILVLSKDTNQRTAMENVEGILTHFSTLRTYPQPSTDNYQFLTSYVSTWQNFVMKQENKYYIYSGTLICKIQIE